MVFIIEKCTKNIYRLYVKKSISEGVLKGFRNLWTQMISEVYSDLTTWIFGSQVNVLNPWLYNPQLHIISRLLSFCFSGMHPSLDPSPTFLPPNMQWWILLELGLTSVQSRRFQMGLAKARTFWKCSEWDHCLDIAMGPGVIWNGK